MSLVERGGAVNRALKRSVRANAVVSVRGTKFPDRYGQLHGSVHREGKLLRVGWVVPAAGIEPATYRLQGKSRATG